MIILAIETSCDDTCVAVVKVKGQKSPSFKILSNIVSSQVRIHRKWGGVYPTLAKREHQKNLPIILKKALISAKNPKINLIAVTVGPGLEPCLWVGVNFAKEIAKKLNLPILPVNHVEAHILSNFLTKRELPLPAVCLIVSGGHTQLILMRNFANYKILGETRDDAAGECFDKVARILGLGYPGGPIISKIAKKAKDRSPSSIKLPRPMIYQKNYDFSFSGLKTAVLYDYKNRTQKIRKSKKYIQEMATGVQQAVIDVLIYKTLRATKEYRAKAIILGGGVTANNELRKQFKTQSSKLKVNFSVPPKNLCTDNAVMVGVTAYFRWQKTRTKDWRNIEAEANLRLK